MSQPTDLHPKDKGTLSWEGFEVILGCW